ncbi:hypothetical protein HanXRQr2_Chr08g0318611 [Helianthus annuus]|uniref:Uncharacterized protein n=1 Tax=Helianthus annuus TaxID=4232 RepID=A0A9K3NAU0_HELAN|nr:hypothetical protein HanXRQr2_Chr08g0318611 [Helianthus annuus]KAJ0899941.1 hypothetical protein HanPSC8_Chr08g0307861 [Helianthus annuus]
MGVKSTKSFARVRITRGLQSGPTRKEKQAFSNRAREECIVLLTFKLYQETLIN